MKNLSSYIDHTLLRPDATESDIRQLCLEAVENSFAAVCVAPYWADTAFNESFNGQNLKVACVISFPHGNSTPQSKILQIEDAIKNGAEEIDMVLNIGAVKSNNWTGVEFEIKRIAEAKKLISCGNFVLKYIVEVGYLTDEELFSIADLLIKYKVDFIKTCTGYGPRNVTIEDIVKIKKHVGDRIKIKASGGIKTYEFCKQLIEAGANRIGTSSGVAIIKGANSNAGETSNVAGY